MNDLIDYLKLINNCDPGAPLLSSTDLGGRLDQIPLDCVDFSLLRNQIQTLNLEQLIPTEEGLARDYRGLGELLGFNKVEVETRFKNSNNPTKSMIDAIINRNIKGSNACVFSLNDLLKLIEKIERFDVIDDLLPNLIYIATSMPSDSRSHRSPQLNLNNQPVVARIESAGVVGGVATQNLVKERDRLTFEDTSSATVQYDAFICYAPEDFHYAKELKDSLEDRGKNVVTADDLLPGHFENNALIRLIDSRCRKVIVVLTPNFSRSRECEIQTIFASEVGIRMDCPKIIPLVYEVCDESTLPRMIQAMSKIYLTGRGESNRNWWLDRLIRSLDAGISPPQTFSAQHDIPLTIAPISSLATIDSFTGPPASNYPSQSQTTVDSGQSFAPIVDLLHSESSSAFMSGSSQTTTATALSGRSMSPSSNDSNNSNKLLKSIRRLFLGSSSSGRDSATPSISSQAMLIVTSSSDSRSYDDDSGERSL